MAKPNIIGSGQRLRDRQDREQAKRTEQFEVEMAKLEASRKPAPEAKNPWQELARRNKAEALAERLSCLELDDVRLMGPAEWSMAAKAAKVQYPSAETQVMVMRMLEQRRAA